MYIPGFHINLMKDVDVDVDVNVNVYKDIFSHTLVFGNLGEAEANAVAYGKDTLSETLTATESIEGHGSAAYSSSLSATNGSWYLIY